MSLYENFNTSQQRRPWFQRHENFVSSVRQPGCAVVHTHAYEDRCEFVTETEDCHNERQFMDYKDFYYCWLSPDTFKGQAFGIFCLFSLCFYYSSFIGTITDIFFCPALKVITKKMGISESFAGITLLAFGTSAPDLVSDLTGIERGAVGGMYSDGMGAAMFISSCVAGYIIMIRPMQMEASTFTRDISFLILAVQFIDFAIKNDGSVSSTEGMIGLYVCYFVIILADQIILLRTISNLEKSVVKGYLPEAQMTRLRQLREEAGFEITIKAKGPQIVEEAKKHEFTKESRRQLMLDQLIESLMPFELEDWHSGNLFDKFCIIIQTPINLIIFAVLPAVDFDRELNGWSKILNCLQIVILPYSLTIIVANHETMGGVSVSVITVCITLPFCILALLVTRPEVEPDIHIFFAGASCFGSIVAIRIFSMEVVNVIDTLGLATSNSTSFLGCTVLAWGNNIGDLVANIEFAQQGFQKMGLASCIAGPLFYLTIKTGCTYLIKSRKGMDLMASQGAMGANETEFVMVNLVLMLVGASLTNFNFRRNLGGFILAIYTLSCFWCLLSEYQIIHAFGTDHSEDYSAFMV